MTVKPRLSELIEDQAKWIKCLQDQQEQLERYRDGKLACSESQVERVASAQAELAGAIENIANAMRDATKPGKQSEC